MKRIVLSGVLLALGCTGAQDRDSAQSRGDVTPVLALYLATPDPAAGWQRVPYDGRDLYLAPEPVVADADIERVVAERGEEGVLLDVQIGPAGAARLARVTAARVGEPMALMLASKVVEAPIIQSEIRGRRMQMGFSAPPGETERMLQLIRGRWPGP